jgi:hypothetical protein
VTRDQAAGFPVLHRLAVRVERVSRVRSPVGAARSRRRPFEAIPVLVIPGAAASLTVVSWAPRRRRAPEHADHARRLLTTRTMAMASPPPTRLDCLLSDSPDGTRQLARCGRIGEVRRTMKRDCWVLFSAVSREEAGRLPCPCTTRWNKCGSPPVVKGAWRSATRRARLTTSEGGS